MTMTLDALERSLNLAWVLIGGFLVMFMQVGFAMVETGLTRARNAVHTMAMNLVVYPIAVLGFWLIGYGLMLGGVHQWPTLGAAFAGAREIGPRVGGHLYGLFGASRFALVSVPHDSPSLAMFLFSAVFLDTAATIPTGALAERWRFSAFLVYALVVGPRAGKFRRDGTIAAIPGHNLPMAVIGTLILAFGWFGFNAGSTLAAADSRIATIAANTMLASASGALGALVFVWYAARKPDVGMICNGLLGGLVAITASCAFVSPAAAVLIGAVAGLTVAWAVVLLEQRFRVDDPVGAIAVHGVCGAWGALAVGLFADGSYGEGWNGVAGPVRGLMFGDAGQLGAQVVGIVANFVFVFLVATLFFRVVDRVIGNRVPAEVELTGLDSQEMGAEAYPPG
jgi:Amt family ammonium transporter